MATRSERLRQAVQTVLIWITGGVAAVAASALLTAVLSLAICLGLHPEAAMRAEPAAAVSGVILAGALVRRAGSAASVGAGAVVGLLWALTWLYLIGRFSPRLWLAEGLSDVTWRHAVAWAAAPALGALGGAIAARARSARRLTRAALILAAPAAVLIVAFANLLLVDAPGRYVLADGAALAVMRPEPDGTTARLLSLDFSAKHHPRIGLYDCDSDDSRPFDDANTSYFGTPALTVFERIGPEALCVVNAGFFTWTESGRIGSHVAPIVVDRRAYYNVFRGRDMWTFGWKIAAGVPEFRLRRDVPFERLTQEFDSAVGHVRPLVVDGKALQLGPGAGVTTLRCSRTSLGWSANSSRLHLLVVCDPDSELASVARWKRRLRQTGGWDLPRVQRLWMRMGVDYAIALDGGDSTQLVYAGPHGTTTVGSARLSVTLGYLSNRPLRLWVPILPARHSDAGVMNYLYIEACR